MIFREKKRIPRLVACVLLLAAPILLVAGSPPTASVKTAAVDVRSEMSADGSVVKVLKKGDKVVVGLELQVEGSDWCEVSEPGKNARLGYVPCQALDRPKPPKAEQAFASSETGVEESPNAGVQVLLGRATTASRPPGTFAPGWTNRHADKRFISGNVEAPDFSLTGLDGRALSLHDLRGHYVLLDFWATWCGPCRMEMPRLDDLQQKYEGRGLEVVGINSGESPGRVRRFIRKNGYSYTILLDPDNQVSRLYDAKYIPTLVIIDPNGDVRFYDSGTYSEKYLEEVLAYAGLR